MKKILILLIILQAITLGLVATVLLQKTESCIPEIHLSKEGDSFTVSSGYKNIKGEFILHGRTKIYIESGNEFRLSEEKVYSHGELIQGYGNYLFP